MWKRSRIGGFGGKNLRLSLSRGLGCISSRRVGDACLGAFLGVGKLFMYIGGRRGVFLIGGIDIDTVMVVRSA